MKCFLSSVLVSILVGLTIQQDIAKREVCQTEGCQNAAKRFTTIMNPNANPCEDFYQFVCGKFSQEAKIDQHYVEKTPFMMIQDDVDANIAELLQKPYNSNNEREYVRYMKDYYQTCMNVDGVERSGNDAFVNILKSANLYNDYSKFDMLDSAARVVKAGVYADFFVDIHVNADPTNNSRNILTARPHLGGFVKDIFYKKGMENEAVKAEYEAMVKILTILGFDEATAKTEMKKVQQMRVNLANNAQFGESSYKRMTLKEFNALVPSFNYMSFMEQVMGMTFADDEPMIVYAPSYYSEVEKTISSAEKQTLAFHFISTSVMMVSKYMTSNVRLAELEVSKAMFGVEAEKPRHLTCIAALAKEFDVGLSSQFILNKFSPAKKSNVIEMHSYVLDKMMQAIKESDVFTEKAKAAALKKARVMKRVIGYPEEYINQNVVSEYYSNIKYPTSGSYFEKMLSMSKQTFARKFNSLRSLNTNDFSSFGDATEMSSNYVSQGNLVRITDAFINEPFYRLDAPLFVNFALLGYSLGHEIAQAYDNVNIERDENGNDISFMDKESMENYAKKAQCLRNYFDKMTVKGMKVDGSRTLAENIADVEGLRLAFKAYKVFTSDYNIVENSLPNLPYSSDQMFFISATSIFCSKKRDAYFQYFMETDGHAPRTSRVHASVSHNEEFSKVFNCPAGSPMNPMDKCFMFRNL